MYYSCCVNSGCFPFFFLSDNFIYRLFCIKTNKEKQNNQILFYFAKLLQWFLQKCSMNSSSNFMMKTFTENMAGSRKFLFQESWHITVAFLCNKILKILINSATNISFHYFPLFWLKIHKEYNFSLRFHSIHGLRRFSTSFNGNQFSFFRTRWCDGFEQTFISFYGAEKKIIVV